MTVSLDKHPNFFIIGFPKCGTTSLAAYLAQHPQVYFSPDKEPHYYTKEVMGLPFHDKYTLKKYMYLFQSVDPSSHLAVGEGSIRYVYHALAIKSILSVKPDAKFIVMLRNPIAAATSLFKERFKGKLSGAKEVTTSFDQAWAWRTSRRLYNEHLPKKCLYKLPFLYDESYMYSKYLKQLYAVVDRENICPIIFEDFFKDTPSEFAASRSY